MSWFGEKRDKPTRQPQLNQEQGYAFRRSRTLTGSASSEVTAASESRAQIKSPRLKSHELKAHRRKLAAYLALSLAALLALLYLLSQFTWSITNLNVSQPLASGVRLDGDRYVGLMENYFNQRPLERFRFALSETSLTTYLQREAPEIRTAALNDDTALFGGSLVLDLRRPILIWQLGDTVYYVDDSGTAFSRNYFAKPRLTVTDKTGLQPADNTVISGRILHFVGRTVALVNDSAYRVSQVVLPADTSRQINLKLVGKPYVIKTQLDRDPAGQATDIIRAVRYMDRHQLSPQYIDLRVSSKAYYR